MSQSASNLAWSGVIPAITTPFDEHGSIDHSFLARHAKWLVEEGCTGVVVCGSLGEGGSLSIGEKAQVFSTCVTAVGRQAPVIAAVSALTTKEAIEIAKVAEDHGCRGLMVLPPYVYVGDWREMKAHVGAVLSASRLSAMLYNNPIAYKVDFLPNQVAELQSEHANLHAVKESSADVRRVAALRELVGDGIKILVGVDDLIVEALLIGAEGWVAGLVNAFPRESVDLFNLAKAGNFVDAMELYKWFLPLLRMDTVPKFVQLIKAVQQEIGQGSARVRAPRLELSAAELAEVRAILEQANAHRPKVSAVTQPA